MSISGLSSGLDTTTIISQLMQLEGAPQAALKTRLIDVRADASAYRTVNSTFTTLRSAAEALTTATAWAPVKASSSTGTVSASASAGAATGQVSFRVENLAARHTQLSTDLWTTSTSARTLTVQDSSAGSTATTVTIAANATLDEAVAAINATPGVGVTATAVNTGDGFRLQLTATGSGADGAFTVSGDPAFTLSTAGADAKLTVGKGGLFPYEVTSTTNTFTDLMPGTTFTVGEAGVDATVTVGSDPAALSAAVQKLVTAANGVLSTIGEYANNKPGSTAVLRGDSSLRGLAGQVLDAVATAVGADGSAARAGLELDRDGRITFDAAALTGALKADPALAQRLVNGSGSGDAAVPGVAQRLLSLAKAATDATTGTLTNLAKGKDTEATDIQQRIEAWDLRLELRQQTLTRQFTAMESALSSLQGQSSWLSSQLASLPTWSSSS